MVNMCYRVTGYNADGEEGYWGEVVEDIFDAKTTVGFAFITPEVTRVVIDKKPCSEMRKRRVRIRAR